MPAALHLFGPCKICQQPANGRHFGVMSCRACAAFFRRAASGNNKYLGVLCANGTCVIFVNGKYHCKPCRLKKCHDVGMDTRKFQTDRDLISSTVLALTTPQSLSNFLGRPELILCCEPDRASHIKTVVDVSFLIDKARVILKDYYSDYDIPLKFSNSLEKLTFAMDDLKLKQIAKVNEEIQQVKYLGKAENLIFWEMTFLGAAKWFSELSEFTKLDMDVKIEILKTAWMLWARIDKLAESVEYQRRKILGDDVYMWTKDSCMDLKDVEVDLKWCTNYTSDQLALFTTPDINKHWKKCIDIFLELEPSNIEINFLIIDLSLSEAAKKLEGNALESCEKLLQIQADNLHHYYVKKLKMPHYSGRLAKLMKVNREIQKEIRERKEQKYIATVFNLFSVEYSHPEMFESA